MIQWSKIEIDEDGAKAISMTELVESGVKYMMFNRPFLYSIVNRKSGTSIMLGAVMTFAK